MTGFEMSYLKRRLRDCGYHVLTFRYRMVTRSLEFNRRRLAAFIAKNRRQNSGPLHLIGHSLGGVLSLHTLRRYPDLPVAKVICLGSPLVDTSAGRFLHQAAPGRALLGKTLPQAVFDQPLGRWEGVQPVGVIAGTQGLGMGRYLMELPTPNDGVVALQETCLPGVTDRLELPMGHTRLVMSRQVADQCHAFLQHDRFDHNSL
jgi:pimeloyl-ACP methyl ester carboxylesterase